MDSNLLVAYKRDANNGFEASQLLASDGYKIVEQEVNNRILDLDMTMKTTADPNVAFACIKEKNGILFFVDTAKELIKRGKDAEKQLAVS